MHQAIGRKLFLRLANAARKRKEAKDQRLYQVYIIEQELWVAETIFDRIALSKRVNINTLLRINNNIAYLRNTIKKIKEKIRNS